MKRIAVVSDTHGDFRHVGAARAKLGGRLDWLLHAGDHYRDAARVANNLGVVPEHVRSVVGNCDYPTTEPAQELVQIEGVKILLTHGHLYGVKTTLERIYYRGAELGARVVIFGHSHIPHLEDDGKVMLFNPGSLHRPHFPTDPPSCGLLEVDGNTINAQHFFLR